MMDFDELEEREEGLPPEDGGAAAAGQGAGEADSPSAKPASECSPALGAAREPAAAGETVEPLEAGCPSPEPAPELDPVEAQEQPEERSPMGSEAVEAIPPSEAEALRESEAKDSTAGNGEDSSTDTAKKQGSTTGAKVSFCGTEYKEATKDSDGLASLGTAIFNAQTWEALDKRCGEIPAVKAVAETVNLSPVIVALIGSCSAVAFLLHGFGGQILCTLLGFLYPAYESFKAAERCQPSVMQFWLMYWVVWALFITVEHLCYYILIWIPFYYPLKLAALICLFHPATQGARVVYRWLLLPVLLRNQEKIDAALEESTSQLKRSVSGALSSAVGVGLNSALAAGAGAVPKVRSLSGLMMEAVLARSRAASQAAGESQ